MEQQNWNVQKEISIKDMQELITCLREAKTAYKEAKDKSDAAYAVLKNLESTVIATLKEAGQDTFTVTGVGKVTVSEQLSVQTPKSIEDKQKFFSFIKEKFGDDGFWAYASINSQSLNSLYKNLTTEYAQNGEVLEIEGLEPASSFTKLSFTKG